jgi:bifunctional enzyme CysN/CysC
MDGDHKKAFAPMSVTFTLEDEIDISRGDMLAHKHNIPQVGRHFESMLIWMDEQAMETGKSYILKHTTQTCKARIDGLRYKVDVNSLSRVDSTKLELNEIGRAVITSNRQLFFDSYSRNRETGSFILIDTVSNATVAAGMIIERKSVEPIISNISDKNKDMPEETLKSLISSEKREKKYGQKPATIWLTGLHASGKSEVAYELEKLLFEENHICSVLTGRTLRSGLNKELDFNISDRAEHLRRAAETADILNQNGIIAICAFISPDSLVREQLAQIVENGEFIEIFISTPLEECRKNDNKKLYDRAEQGVIDNLAGVSFPYEEPENPAIAVNISELSPKTAATKIVQVLKDKNIIF